MKTKKSRLKRFGFFLLAGILLTTSVWPSSKLLAVDSSRVNVNGITVYDASSYEATDGYNTEHGISGVSFNTTNKTLDLTSASLESIYANGDLTINITNNNAVDAVTSSIAIETRGNLTVIGSNGSALNVSAMSADDRAIEISAGSTLTVGKPYVSDFITLNINRGRNVNTVDNTVVVAGNTYNYTAPSSGDPESPPASGTLTLSIGGTVVIDETADPQITSNSGEGWSIEGGSMGIYQLEIDSGATLGYLTATGDGNLSINPGGSDITISANGGYSIYADGNVGIMTAMGTTVGDIYLDGGIYTQGSVQVNDRDMFIGSEDSASTKGVEASSLLVGMGNLTIYTSGTALQYYNPDPAEGESLLVESSSGHSLDVVASDIATANVSSINVSGGGDVELNYTSTLGTFTPEASHWPWTDMTGTEEENPQPTTVTCEEGTDTTNKYRMTTSEGNFLLESTAGTLYQLGWNIPGADDSIVTNGTVRVIAANGYRFTSGGYTDYTIEAGSPITIELLPDYGYQYVSGGLNGSQTQPEEGKASYSFVMPSNHLHLSAIFEPKSDIVNVNDSMIKSATINMPANQIQGNAELTINDDTIANESGFKTAAGSLAVADYLDLGLNEVIYKGTTEDSWKTPITELGEEMTVNVKLSDQLQGYTNYTILRDHNGTITKLASTYDPNTGTLSFQTDAYSDYAIAHGEKVTNPNTYDGITKYFIIAPASLIGLCLSVYALRRKRNLTQV